LESQLLWGLRSPWKRRPRDSLHSQRRKPHEDGAERDTETEREMERWRDGCGCQVMQPQQGGQWCSLETGRTGS
jgi:hypothetical protein